MSPCFEPRIFISARPVEAHCEDWCLFFCVTAPASSPTSISCGSSHGSAGAGPCRCAAQGRVRRQAQPRGHAERPCRSSLSVKERCVRARGASGLRVPVGPRARYPDFSAPSSLAAREPRSLVPHGATPKHAIASGRCSCRTCPTPRPGAGWKKLSGIWRRRTGRSRSSTSPRPGSPRPCSWPSRWSTSAGRARCAPCSSASATAPRASSGPGWRLR